MASRSPPIAAADRSGAAFIALVACAVAGGLVLWAVADLRLAAGFLAAGVLAVAAVMLVRRMAPAASAPEADVDWSIARALADAAVEAVAITDHGGKLVCANRAYEEAFAGLPTPPNLPCAVGGVEALAAAGRAAWRDGAAQVPALSLAEGSVDVTVTRAGAAQNLLIWRFGRPGALGAGQPLEAALADTLGNRLTTAGIMAAIVAPDGRVLSANRGLRLRAGGHEEAVLAGRDFAALFHTGADGALRFAREGVGGTPLRLVPVPHLEGDGAPLLVALLDEAAPAPALNPGGAEAARALVALMPFGVALIDREGRLLHFNEAFGRVAGADPAAPPLYPGDLVVREDKTAIADAVRRFTGGAAQAAEIAVRLSARPDEPVALSITGARGLGEAAVLIAVKDSGEESRLKREVAQATKMQAVGQLAGGVAHDFNNILTAILGHCDLMLMRHAPGDSDYDDIQQIRANSNRAASLTRQLLAFSRQQTLRPQVLQLPDVISEVSNLLKRLLGETVMLEVKHGRNLGPVRADPGQLEQVVMNLAVNARDAMVAKSPRGGGTLTIQTLSVTAADVRRMESEILPVADYTALRVSDTGTGIPPDILPKIFEPFFTTKEVGKGTGLGLSTVYGIVKQSGGYIFADSKPGQGAEFTIYLPVHRAGAPGRAAPKPKRAEPAPSWGSGTILLVEDEDMVRAVAERALSRQGYGVRTAEHGEAALELLAQMERPDLLITDVVMPTMDGPTMVRQVRNRYPDLPILFMSGYAEEQLRKSIDLDNVSFLPKPFSVQQLTEAAQAALAAQVTTK
ncbi:PAS domain-containing sensor histidine kinase [Sphingomonas sp.]|uniref:hybrid sensor histidine kinase/response regulator n=1 Tax=Sphingomonas sp. TaxID=28214 RepID=UPI0025E3D1ED|nr:PAS domain-containing sensor histidine kinase [Sphingomonas sp.]